jgi:hypothetical protein
MENYAKVTSMSSSSCAAFSRQYYETSPPNSITEFFTIPDSNEIAPFEPQSLAIILISHLQCCGGGIETIHVTLPPRSVSSTQLKMILVMSKSLPSSLHDNYRIISKYMMSY